MASKAAATTVLHQVKPLMSLDHAEARRRVIDLYKAWYRQIPYVVFEFDLPINTKKGRAKLRELFEMNRNVTDIRTIDMLVIKGQMELKETVNHWKTPSHVMHYFKETHEEKPKDFLSKFLGGHN